METGRKIKVLIVDDSTMVRKILSAALAGQKDVEVVGTAPDPYVARTMIQQLKPDVLTLDLEMPRMDGLTFLKMLMRHHAMPVIVISSVAQASCEKAIEALRLGAVEVLGKPSGPDSVGDLRFSLATKVRAAAQAKLSRPAAAEAGAGKLDLSLPAGSDRQIIAIGCSTGGTEALAAVLPLLPENCPGVVVVQHIPAGFSRTLARQLNQISRIEVKEATNGDLVRPGCALIAPGNFHMLVVKAPNGYCVHVKDGPPVCYQRPSVDVLFASVAQAVGKEAIGLVLTGMGVDGAQGMLRMKQAGARTMAQDEASCVVFGMPREAIRLNAADQVVSLHHVASALLHAIRGGRKAA